MTRSHRSLQHAIQRLSILSTLTLLLSGTAKAAPQTGQGDNAGAVAVTDFSSADKAQGKETADNIASELPHASPFRVCDREAVRATVARLGSGPEAWKLGQAHKFGADLHAAWVIAGSLVSNGGQMTLRARIWNTRTGLQEPNSGAVVIGSANSLHSLTRDLTHALATKLTALGAAPAPVADPIPAPAPTPERHPSETPVANHASEDHYTGLVVDVRQFNLQRDASPTIFDENGDKVYPDMAHIPDPDWVVEHGMAAYTFEVTNTDRAGNHPLIVTATGVRGPGPFDLVVSMEDAQRIRAANRRDGILAHYEVTLVTRSTSKSFHISKELLARVRGKA